MSKRSTESTKRGIIEIQPGSNLSHAGSLRTTLDVDTENVASSGDDGDVHSAVETFEEEIRDGRIGGAQCAEIPEEHAEIARTLRDASPSVLAEAARRIEIRQPSHAKAYGKIGKQLLLKHLKGAADARLPTRVTRNAICRGFGYSSFNQIEDIARNPNRALPPVPSDEQLLAAFTRGFGFALVVARDHGFTCETSPEVLAPQIALEAVEIIRARRSQRTIDREFHNELLPGEVPVDDDIAERGATLSRKFAPRGDRAI